MVEAGNYAIKQLYVKNRNEWREWLSKNHAIEAGSLSIKLLHKLTDVDAVLPQRRSDWRSRRRLPSWCL